MWNARMNINPFYSMKILIALIGFGLMFYSSNSLAQNNTSSPYSYYGLGELMQNSSGNGISMGGTSLGYRGGSVLNLNNPAALAHIDSLKFHFNVGMVAKFTDLKQGDDSDNFNDFNLSRIALGFKVSPRIGTALSISPYSSLGYNITERAKVIGSNENSIQSLQGTGGLNQFVWSNGFKVSEKLSLGFNGIYLFGNNSRIEVVSLENSNSNTYRNVAELISKGLYFNIGAQYKEKIGDYHITFGGKYQPKLGLKATQKIEITNSNTANSRYEDEDKGTFDIPESYGFGIGVNKGRHIWFGADYLHESWSTTEIFRKNNDLVDRDKFSIGFEYNADDGYARKFFKKLSYRFGGFYDTGYINVKDENINSMGVSAGIGIPMAQNKGMINFAVEYGVTGMTSDNLVRENFTRVTLDISLFERWFVKRKYQ